MVRRLHLCFNLDLCTCLYSQLLEGDQTDDSRLGIAFSAKALLSANRHFAGILVTAYSAPAFNRDSPVKSIRDLFSFLLHSRQLVLYRTRHVFRPSCLHKSSRVVVIIFLRYTNLGATLFKYTSFKVYPILPTLKYLFHLCKQYVVFTRIYH